MPRPLPRHGQARADMALIERHIGVPRRRYDAPPTTSPWGCPGRNPCMSWCARAAARAATGFRAPSPSNTIGFAALPLVPHC